MINWTSRDVVAVIFAASVPMVLLYALTARLLGEGLPAESATAMKEILLVVTGGLIMWLGGERKSNDS